MDINTAEPTTRAAPRAPSPEPSLQQPEFKRRNDEYIVQPGTQSPVVNPVRRYSRYVNIAGKFTVAVVAGTAWCSLSVWLAMPWIGDLTDMSHWLVAFFAVGGIAIVPGFMNAFLISSLMMDRRPVHQRLHAYPGLTILVAVYNEQDSIADTLASIERQDYPGPLQVMIIDDGSTDKTAREIAALSYPWLTLITQKENKGKAAALNRGLAKAEHELIVTLDGDSFLHIDALTNIVERYMNDPSDTRAVAGSMLVRNSRSTWVTRMQEWDYFHGIAAIKRIQSMYQGTLVAQGAFSIYDRATLRQLGGWADCIGEDIVLTWAILKAGWRVGHAEDAMCFTNVPEKLGQLLNQRQRWARGMMEGFRHHRGMLFQPRLSSTFIWWNLLFPWLDLAYTLCFIPGIVLALFGIYWIVGPMTLLLLPLSFLLNGVMYYVSEKMFAKYHLHVRFNPLGFLTYTFLYSLILQPVSVAGYFTEIFGMKKTWGTK